MMLNAIRTGNPLTQTLHQNSHFIQQLALQDLDGVVISIAPLQLRKLETNGFGVLHTEKKGAANRGRGT